MRVLSAVVLISLTACGPTTALDIVDELEAVSVLPVQSTGGGSGTTAPVTMRFPSLPVTCWASPDSTCHPVTNEGCAPNQLCLLTNTAPERVGLRCIDVEGTRSISQTCNLQSGPYCRAGMWCTRARAGRSAVRRPTASVARPATPSTRASAPSASAARRAPTSAGGQARRAARTVSAARATATSTTATDVTPSGGTGRRTRAPRRACPSPPRRPTAARPKAHGAATLRPCPCR